MDEENLFTNKKPSIWYPTTTQTHIIKNKNFSKKETFSQRLYKLRLNYGEFSSNGLFPTDIQMKRLLDDRSTYSVNSYLNSKRIREGNEEEEENENKNFACLLYDLELLCNQETRREINLKALLNKKLNKLSMLLEDVKE